jgi:hypothetical protein
MHCKKLHKALWNQSPADFHFSIRDLRNQIRIQLKALKDGIIEKQEAYKTIKENLCAMCAYGSQCMELCDIRSCDNRDAIKALEQDSVIDKIRTEMLEEMLSHSGTGEEVIQAYADGLKKGLDIIDKYKAETEDNNE